MYLVAGYDDLPIAEHFIPALTTIHQPRRALGRLAAETLLALLNKETIDAVQVIDPWLMARDSTSAYLEP
ncbi:substrate-binding domain-containing protein [Thiolinea disciformis]|uniref:substrate-binding domain-containing protein n=1 Tax=Thiolinea disciformis TaxID=125614 RepID=UPI000382A623|nr:substrate-binding domain-containing protein [Thiolinea disciformis]